MKSFRLAGLLIGLALISNAVFAEQGDYYIVPKGGMMRIDYYSANSLFALGIYGGYGLNRHIAVEAETNYGFVGGRYQDGANNGQYRVVTGAIYGAYRAMIIENIFLKAKIGGVVESVKNISKTTVSNTALGVSGGLGFSVRLEDVLTLEAEYTLIETNVSFLSVGAHYRF